ncbi:hypothetical protein DFP72DRAFT_1104277 [Ephemerocybe angulata]|uniref:F-box domain-containing protein n=1 Tax=Ephemerocybe angulata TaxID=980116 RepID=A0A8H6M8M9_9AGAR|nr:hypothetical protein DFP72DRAFT_1104277 [Tulosesus angulatus]
MSELVVQSATLNGRAHSINRLPNETINEIFLSGSLTLSTNPAKNTSPAFTLLLVCRHWKALATALTPLWTTLNLDRHYLERRSGRAAAEVLLWKFAKLCLSKSTTQPLHLTFCHAIGAPLERLAQLGATSDRWVTLTLYSNTLTDILNDRKTFVGFPALQALNTCTGEVADVLDADLYRDMGMTAPRLAYFSLRVCLSGVQRATARDAFLGLSDDIVKSVTHLSLERCLHLWLLPPRMRTMLGSDMDRLTHLYLKLPGHTKGGDSSSAPFADHLTLPYLTFLSLDSFSCRLMETRDDVWRNLDHLRLPALEHLFIAQILPETQDPHTNAFFTRFLSNCRQIRTLATRQVSLKHTSALVEALKPERVFLSNNFNRPSMRAIVSDLVKGITNLGESQTTSRLREVILCDLAVSGALLARGIVGTLMECARTQPGFASLDRPVKAVQVHSLSQDVPESLKEYVDRPALMAGVYMRLAFKAREPDVDVPTALQAILTQPSVQTFPMLDSADSRQQGPNRNARQSRHFPGTHSSLKISLIYSLGKRGSGRFKFSYPCALGRFEVIMLLGAATYMNSKVNGPVIGIDLGTTNSRVAIMEGKTSRIT